jgi:hypothetical protein
MTEAPMFLDDDLEANRRGVLSERQRDRLRQAQRSKLLPELGIFGVGVVLMVIGFINPTDFDFSICLPIGVGVALYAIYLAVRSWRTFDADLRAGQVATVSGSARLVGMTQGRQSSLWLEIGNARFAVSPQTFQSLAPGTYRAYYAPQSLMLLSLERLNL